jgi:hypothetical protein
MQISNLQTWLVIGILRFQKQFDVDVLDFQIELCYRYLGVFWFGDYLAQFLKNWAIFFKSSSGHPHKLIPSVL